MAVEQRARPASCLRLHSNLKHPELGLDPISSSASHGHRRTEPGVTESIGQKLREQHSRGAHAPSRAVSEAHAGNSAGTTGWVRTMIPKRYRTLSPAAGQRGRSPEHARARMLPVGFADALPTTFSYTRRNHGTASRAILGKWAARRIFAPSLEWRPTGRIDDC